MKHRITDGQIVCIMNCIWISLIILFCTAVILFVIIPSFSDYESIHEPESSSELFSEPEPIPTPIEPSTIDSSISECSYEDIDLLDLPRGSDGSFKAWEDKDSITRKDSAQYKLLQRAEPNQYGFMCYDGYYLVAMGTYYAHNIGDRLIVCFENGVSIPVIIGDVKNDKDTVDGMYCKHNASVVEFIIDKTVMKKEYWIQGDLSCLGFEGSITMIRRVG